MFFLFFTIPKVSPLTSNLSLIVITDVHQCVQEENHCTVFYNEKKFIFLSNTSHVLTCSDLNGSCSVESQQRRVTSCFLQHHIDSALQRKNKLFFPVSFSSSVFESNLKSYPFLWHSESPHSTICHSLPVGATLLSKISFQGKESSRFL